jgi:hypothetical protein
VLGPAKHEVRARAGQEGTDKQPKDVFLSRSLGQVSRNWHTGWEVRTYMYTHVHTRACVLMLTCGLIRRHRQIYTHRHTPYQICGPFTVTRSPYFSSSNHLLSLPPLCHCHLLSLPPLCHCHLLSLPPLCHCAATAPLFLLFPAF